MQLIKKAKFTKINLLNPRRIFFSYNSRTPYDAILMKLCPTEQNLFTNILKLNCKSHVAYAHAQLLHIWANSEFTDQDFRDKLGKCHILGSRGGISLKGTLTSKYPWQKKLPDDVIFTFDEIIKNRFLVCKLQPVTWPSQEGTTNDHHQSTTRNSDVSLNFISCVELRILEGVYISFTPNLPYPPPPLKKKIARLTYDQTQNAGIVKVCS